MRSSRHISLLRHALSRNVSSSSSASAIAQAAASATPSATASATATDSDTSFSYVPPGLVSRNTIQKHRVMIGPTGLNRLSEHYRRTLCYDMLYMAYDHNLDKAPPAEQDPLRRWDPEDPYSENRPVRPARGNRRPVPISKPFSPIQPLEDIPRLERIVITAFCKEAIANKGAIVPLIAQMRAITGITPLESNTSGGSIEVVKAKKGIAAFKLRPGLPVAVKADLPELPALEFLDVLTTFVLPRLRNFNGFPLPAASQPPYSPAAVSGAVSLGMSAGAMRLFPQLEINIDQYPGQTYGFQIDCITNQRGRKATERARALLSGLGVPFVRHGKKI